MKEINCDLLERDVLDQWYSKERLLSDRARKQFGLPVVNDMESTRVYNSPRIK